MSRDDLGDRMKIYEQVEAGRKFMPLLPVCARIDGKSFHSYTKGLTTPYDKGFRDLMTLTTLCLVQETQANMGYTQSDEINLVWYQNNFKSQIFFEGKIHKMASILASMTTAYFNSSSMAYIPSKQGKAAIFDCRVWQVPSLEEGANVFLWREMDATRNSVESAARCYYSHKFLNLKNQAVMMDLLMKAGVNWNDYPTFFKRGTYVQKRKIIRKFTTEEIDKLPPKHTARKDPDLMIERTDYQVLNMPPLSKVTNRVGVIFFGDDPIISGEWKDGQ